MTSGKPVQLPLTDWKRIAAVLMEDGYRDLGLRIHDAVTEAQKVGLHSKAIFLNEDERMVVREAGQRRPNTRGA